VEAVCCCVCASEKFGVLGSLQKTDRRCAKRMRMLKINDLDRLQRDDNLALSLGLQVVDSMRKFSKRAYWPFSEAIPFCICTL
jgi:hypothetical protein